MTDEYTCDNCGASFRVDVTEESLIDSDVNYCPCCGTSLGGEYDEDDEEDEDGE